MSSCEFRILFKRFDLLEFVPNWPSGPIQPLSHNVCLCVVVPLDDFFLLLLCGRCLWTHYVDNFCGHFSWTLFVNTLGGHFLFDTFCLLFFVENFCGPFLWTLFLDTFYGHILRTHFVDTFSGHFLWELFV